MQALFVLYSLSVTEALYYRHILLYLNRLNSVCYNLKQTLIGTESIGAYMVKLITFLFQVKLEEIASYYILNV